jgi:hypothetical protein
MLDRMQVHDELKIDWHAVHISCAIISFSKDAQIGVCPSQTCVM